MTSNSYDRLPVRCLINFFIFLAADGLSQSIAERTERRRRRRRRKSNKSIIVDLADDIELVGNPALASSSSSSSSSPSSSAPLAPSSGHVRSLRFALFGALVHAPACSLFFGALDARFPGNGWQEVSLKLAADRATLAPALLLVALLWMRLPVALLFDEEGSSSSASTSLSSPACLEALYEQGKKQPNRPGEDEESKPVLFAAAVDDALHRLPRAYALSCLFWVPAHSLGFAAVPPRWRVLYVALASLVWNCALAWISSEPASAAAAAAAKEERQRQRRGAAGGASSSSLPLFTKRQTRKARYSDSTEH